MINRINNKNGVTLMELMIYLGISSIIALAMTSFLTNVTKQRVEISNQQIAQYNARQVLEKLTYSLRNAYEVEVNPDGTAVNIFSNNYDNPLQQPIISTYIYKNQKLYYGQSVINPPAEDTLLPITDEGLSVDNINFSQVSSSLKLQLVISKSGRQSGLDSTIAFRQLSP